MDGKSSVASNIHGDTGLSPDTCGYCKSIVYSTMMESHMTVIALNHTVDTVLDSDHLRLIASEHYHTHSFILNTVTTGTHYTLQR